jgi:formate hydrogenlyase subunit 3/multisubunit Na+/H+ antiporter MnhD subunit
MAFFLIGIFLLYQHTGTLAILDMARLVTAVPSASPQISVAIVALIIGLGVRTAFFRFHTWLPDAHAYAPHPISAMLSGVHLKISFLTIWRFVVIFEMHNLQTLLLWLGAGTALIAVIWALMQTDCKKLLAWHSISQMGYILAGFGTGHTLGLTASFLHVINHGLFKSLLFLSVGSVIHVTGERSLKQPGNLAGKFPVLTLMFLAGALSIAGIPPFNGFVSKKLLLLSVKRSSVIYIALWLASAGTVASFTKLSGIFRNPLKHPASASRYHHKLSHLAYIPLSILAFFCLVMGVFGRDLTNFLSTVLFGQPATFNLSFYTLTNLLDTVFALGIGILLYKVLISARGQKIAALMRQKFVSLDTALLWLVIGFLGLAAFVLLDFSQ